MVLEQFKKDSGETLDGYIGGRVPKEMELDFKKVCKENNIKVAEALRILIAAELNQLQFPGAPAPVKEKKVQPVSPPAASSVPVAPPVAGAPVAAYVRKENGNKRLPCPVCNNWSNYSTFKKRHTEKHGFTDTVKFMETHYQRVMEMLEEKSQEN